MTRLEGCSLRARRGRSLRRPGSSTSTTIGWWRCAEYRGAGDACLVRETNGRWRPHASRAPTIIQLASATTATRVTQGQFVCRRRMQTADRRADRDREPERDDPSGGNHPVIQPRRDRHGHHREAGARKRRRNPSARACRGSRGERRSTGRIARRGAEALAVRVDERVVESRPAKVPVLRGLGGGRSRPGDRGEDTGARDEAPRWTDSAMSRASSRAPARQARIAATSSTTIACTRNGRWAIRPPRGAAPAPTRCDAHPARGRRQEAPGQDEVGEVPGHDVHGEHPASSPASTQAGAARPPAARTSAAAARRPRPPAPEGPRSPPRRSAGASRPAPPRVQARRADSRSPTSLRSRRRGSTRGRPARRTDAEPVAVHDVRPEEHHQQ